MTPPPLRFRTFKEIARELAKKHHGGLWRSYYNDYLEALISDLWSQRFVDDDGQSRVFYLYLSGKLAPESSSRREVWDIIPKDYRPRVVRDVPESAPPPSWELLAAAKLEDYDHMTVHRLFEALAMSEADARAWMKQYDEENLPRVKFAHGLAKSSADQRPEKRGRKQKYDWDAFQRAIVEIADKDGLPTTQAELEKLMMEWCIMNWGDTPSMPTIRSRVKDYYPRPYIKE